MSREAAALAALRAAAERAKDKPLLPSFLEDVKKSYSPTELRAAADQLLRDSPDAETFIPGKLWPPLLRRPKGKLSRPSHVMVLRPGRTVMIEYAGSFFLLGIYIQQPDAGELAESPNSKTKFLRWEDGIYVYYCP
jgi:hypothetical protein